MNDEKNIKRSLAGCRDRQQNTEKFLKRQAPRKAGASKRKRFGRLRITLRHATPAQGDL